MSSLSASEPVTAEPKVERGPAVRVEHLSVTYRTTYETNPTLRTALSRLGRRQRAVREIEAVKDVSFEVPHGEVLGIVGANGAGKSTLMRTVAGILPPTSGRIEVDGRVSTLLALGVGFNRDLSGRENVILGGLAAGLSKEQLRKKYKQITKFAELEEFMDLPMRTYSSGMYGRLAFSVAVNMDPDILLVDEALSVGDARFKRKSLRRMAKLCEQAGTILIVSHAMGTLQDLCTRVAWMHQGQLMMCGDTEEVIDAYTEFLEIAKEDAAALEDL